MTFHKITNEFERLVVAACEQNWPWKITGWEGKCTEFRNGLVLIGKGQLPDDLSQKTLSPTEVLYEAKYTERKCCDEDLRLTVELVRANLKKLSTLSCPHWLGYLGLALCWFDCNDSTETFIRRKHFWSVISSSWGSQFLRLLGDDAEKPTIKLLQKCEKGRRLLRWKDMTPIGSELSIQGDFSAFKKKYVISFSQFPVFYKGVKKAPYVNHQNAQAKAARLGCNGGSIDCTQWRNPTLFIDLKSKTFSSSELTLNQYRQKHGLQGYTEISYQDFMTLGIGER